jgi:hypothetical protein
LLFVLFFIVVLGLCITLIVALIHFLFTH